MTWYYDVITGYYDVMTWYYDVMTRYCAVTISFTDVLFVARYKTTFDPSQKMHLQQYWGLNYNKS